MLEECDNKKTNLDITERMPRISINIWKNCFEIKKLIIRNLIEI